MSAAAGDSHLPQLDPGAHEHHENESFEGRLKRLHERDDPKAHQRVTLRESKEARRNSRKRGKAAGGPAKQEQIGEMLLVSLIAAAIALVTAYYLVRGLGLHF